MELGLVVVVAERLLLGEALIAVLAHHGEQAGGVGGEEGGLFAGLLLLLDGGADLETSKYWVAKKFVSDGHATLHGVGPAIGEHRPEACLG